MKKALTRFRRRSEEIRRGSTLVIVLALLALLAVLGFTFFTFSAQERAASEYFATETRTAEPNSSDAIFDYALRQILIGPDDNNLSSMLWGGRFSLVPTMVGRDLVPFNGEGVNIVGDPTTGDPIVDMDFDGTADSVDFLNIVDSPAANGGILWGAGKSLANLPAPDVDYTYPDVNNMLVSYDGFAVDATVTPSRVIVPTLLRPQYLRSGGVAVNGWFDNGGVIPGSQSFRPHRDHQCVDSNGASTGVARYIATLADAIAMGVTRPFSFAPITSAGQYSNGELGVWTASAPSIVNLDVDTDGDGIQESILVDLGYPPFRRSDGKLVVPLFAIQVRDLNGLINLNTSTSALSRAILPPDITTQEFGADSTGAPRFLSSSDQGLLTSEVNSIYGLGNLSASVSSKDLQQYRFFLTVLGANRDPLSAREVANLEWFFLNYGRPRFNVAAGIAASSLGSPAARAAAMIAAVEIVTPGLLGDPTNLLNVLSSGSGSLPQPGRVGVNDNADSGNPVTFFWTNPSPEQTPIGSPLDLLGIGTTLASNAGGLNPYGKKLRLFDRSNRPEIGSCRWLTFQSFHSNSDVSLLNSAASTYGALLMPSATNHLIDDTTEVIVDPLAVKVGKLTGIGAAARDAIDNDAIFNLSETSFLHLNNVDGALVESGSRVADLLPVSTMISTTALATRSQYTTVSSDRREFSKYTTGLTTTTTPSVKPPLRNWESSYLGAPGNTPMRRVTWYLMSGYSTLSSQEMRLSANQLLVDSNGEPFPEAFSVTPPTGLRFRDLTPHPSKSLGLSSSVIQSASIPFPTSGFSSSAQQEYFARRDRQALARDIYTLLYLYCGGLDQNPLDVSLPVPYTRRQLKDMAQFAVNYVDALDRDDVSTRFEYDTDLRDGWGLDDNAYTTTETQRAEVWGVETQQLTFSEALAIKAPRVLRGGMPYNHPATEYDDTSDRFFTYVDLQNASPYAINFTTANAWQIRVLPKGELTTVADERRLTPKVGQVAAGGSFTIVSAGDATTFDQMNNPTSFFRVDPYYTTGGTANPTLIAPATIPVAGSRLDLVVDPGTNYLLTDGASPPLPKAGIGDFLNAVNAPDPTSTAFAVVFRLMRRADPNRTPPIPGTPTEVAEEADNPWIEVDRIQLGTDTVKSGLTLFPLLDTTDANASPGSLTDMLTALNSRVRAEPFAADAEHEFLSTEYWSNIAAPASWSPKPPLKFLANYLGQAKYDPTITVPPVAQYSQFHFDRPFASLGELLEIPLVAPGLSRAGDAWYDPSEIPADAWYLTRALAYAKQSPANQIQAGTPNTSAVPDKRALTAAAKFLLADFPASVDATPNFDNRWYRLFEFLEVSSPMHRHPELRNYSVSQLGLPVNFGWPIIQGQLNLNMIRHPSVLAGLLDDTFVLNVQPNSLPGMDTADTSATDPRPYSPARDWWIEFLRSRDGFDPALQMYLPGGSRSRKFRSFNFASNGPVTQKQDTLFRILPADTNVAGSGPANVQDQRHLFEIGQQGEHSNGTLDSIARNRLLSKVMNNVTTRSNTFGVFIAVQYFEAAQTTSSTSVPVLRIGGRLDDTPTKRAFFILDRTGAVEQIKQLLVNIGANSNIVPVGDQATYPVSTFPVSVNTFSLRANTDTSGAIANQNGIKWEDLVIYRQILN